MKEFIFISSLMLLLMMGCSNNDLDQDQANNGKLQAKALENKMAVLYDEILALIEDTSCNDPSSCKTIAIGAKACGGPTHYLVYSAPNVDESLLIAKLKEYRSLNVQYNLESGVFSDCMVVGPPDVTCKDGHCVEVVY